jgi:hypothetical protein
VLTAGVSLDHVRQRGHHVLDPLHALGVGLRHRLLDAAELAVQHLAPEQVPELLEGLRGSLAAPLVVVQLPDRAGGVGGQRVELGLTHPGVVAGIGEQLGALLADRGVEQRPGLLEDAVQPAAAAQIPLPFPDLPQQILQAVAVRESLPEQVAQRTADVLAVEHRLAERVDGPANVVRGLERVGPAVVRTVPVPAHGLPSRSASVDRTAVDDVLGQPAHQVQALERELQRGRRLAE